MSKIDQNARVHPSQFRTSKGMTRRQLVQMIASGVVLVGGSALSACGNPSSSQQKITLTATGWPFGAMPDKATQDKDPLKKAYAESLTTWFKENPGVEIKASTLNIWDQQAISTAISAGTAPSVYFGNVLGNYNESAIRSAILKGLAAETTTVAKSYNVEELMADYALNAWNKQWKIDNKFYGAPGDFFAGIGIYYRRDWFQEAGLEEPKPGWTWNDLRGMAKKLTTDKRKGFGAQKWILDWLLRANQFDMRTLLPAPKASWHWKYDIMTNYDEWANLVNIYRGMFTEDKSVAADVTYEDGQLNDAFARGDIAMYSGLNAFFTGNPAEQTSFAAAIAQKANKPLDEVVGWIQHPNGTNGAFGNTQGGINFGAFNPRLKSAELDKAYNLYVYMYYGQGYMDQQAAKYQLTKDPRVIYTNASPRTKIQQIPGVPGDFADAWGTRFTKSVQDALAIPLVPNAAWYIPIEQNTGPTADAYNDARSDMTFTNKDLRGIFSHYQDVVNQQVQSFSAAVPHADFVKGAQAYYKAHESFWKANAPEFYESVYKQWYANVILPTLK